MLSPTTRSIWPKFPTLCAKFRVSNPLNVRSWEHSNIRSSIMLWETVRSSSPSPLLVYPLFWHRTQIWITCVPLFLFHSQFIHFVFCYPSLYCSFSVWFNGMIRIHWKWACSPFGVVLTTLWDYAHSYQVIAWSVQTHAWVHTYIHAYIHTGDAVMVMMIN